MGKHREGRNNFTLGFGPFDVLRQFQPNVACSSRKPFAAFANGMYP